MIPAQRPIITLKKQPPAPAAKPSTRTGPCRQVIQRKARLNRLRREVLELRETVKHLEERLKTK